MSEDIKSLLSCLYLLLIGYRIKGETWVHNEVNLGHSWILKKADPISQQMIRHFFDCYFSTSLRTESYLALFLSPGNEDLQNLGVDQLIKIDIVKRFLLAIHSGKHQALAGLAAICALPIGQRSALAAEHDVLLKECESIWKATKV